MVSLNLSTWTTGEYTLNITYPGTYQYYPAENISFIKVKTSKIETRILVENLTIYYSEDKNLTVKLVDENNTPIVNKNLNIDFGLGETPYTTDSQGIITVNLNSLSIGEYNVSFNFTGDETYASFKTTSFLNITTINTTLSTVNLIINYNDNIELKVSLKDFNGNPLTSKSITLNSTILNNTYTTNLNGEISIPLNTWNSGNYTLNFTFKGDNLYTPSSIISNLSIKPLETFIYLSNISLTKGEDKNLTITLKDSKGNLLTGKTLNITTPYITNLNGEVTIPLNTLSTGNHTLNISFSGDTNYFNSSNSCKIIVNPIKTIILTSNINLTENDPVNLTITLTSITGEKLNNKNITITYNTTTLTKTTNTNGEILIPLDTLSTGNYTFNISFPGDSDYSVSTNISLINVKGKPQNTTLNTVNLNLTYNTNTNLTISLKDLNGNLLTGKNITITYNTTTLTKTTNTNGEINIPLNTLSTGNYTFNISFPGDSDYNPSNTTSLIQISPGETILLSTNISLNKGDNKNLQITLKDSNGNPLRNKTITITSNTTTLTRITDTNGIITLPLNTWNTGNYTLNISFNGDNNYKSSNTTSTVNITISNILKTFILGFDTVSYQGDYDIFIIQLIDSNGNPLINQDIYFKTNTTSLNLKTNTNGVSYVPLNTWNKGTYQVTYTYLGDENHYPSEKTSTIIILEKTNPINPNPEEPTNTTPEEEENTTIITEIQTEELIKTYGTSTEYQGKLINKKTNQAIIGQYIYITLTRITNGQSKTYTTVTDYNGIYTLPINLAPGKYTAEIKYEGLNLNNTTYLNSTNKTQITVTEKTINTIIKTNTFKQPVNAGLNFNGTLTLIDNTPLAGQHIYLNLTRITNGQSKVYTVITDYKGIFTLPINLNYGEYTVQCTYDGIGEFKPTSTKDTITVY